MQREEAVIAPPIEKLWEAGQYDISSVPALPEYLESWKAVADYLRRDIRTVQRWEKSMGLPVHRIQDSKSGSVYGCRSEIDAWRRQRAMKHARAGLPVVCAAIPEQPSARGETGHRCFPWRMLLLLAGFVLGMLFNQLVSSFSHGSASAHSVNTSDYRHSLQANHGPTTLRPPARAPHN